MTLSANRMNVRNALLSACQDYASQINVTHERENIATRVRIIVKQAQAS